MDILDRDLEAVEASGFRELDLAAEVARQVLEKEKLLTQGRVGIRGLGLL